MKTKFYVSCNGLDVQCDEFEKDKALNTIWFWKNKEVVASCRLDEFALVYSFKNTDTTYLNLVRVEGGDSNE